MIIIPVLMEESMRNTDNWGKQLKHLTGGDMYVDYCEDKNLSLVIDRLVVELISGYECIISGLVEPN